MFINKLPRTFRKKMPLFLRRKVLQIIVKVKFRGGERRIQSVNVSPDISLGQGVDLAEGVVIRDGVTVGDYSYCNRGAMIFQRVSIGKYCSIGPYCQIGVPEHPVDFLSTSPTIYRDKLKTKAKWNPEDIVCPPIINNDVWIGSHAIILQGVTIGDGAVIAAGAVVTKDVPAYAIAAGVPAKVIKYRFDASKIEELSKSQWWDKDFTWIEDYIKCNFET